MFRITEDPSSRSFVKCLVKNYKNGSISSVDMDVVSVMASYLSVVHVYSAQYTQYTHGPWANMLP